MLVNVYRKWSGDADTEACSATDDGGTGDAASDEGATLEQHATAILLLPLLVFGSVQLVSVCLPENYAQHMKWIILILSATLSFFSAYATASPPHPSLLLVILLPFLSSSYPSSHPPPHLYT